MKITLDQSTLAQAVTHHLRSIGVTADITQVNFRYNRTPFSVFAEVELSEARVQSTPPRLIPAFIAEKPEAAAPNPIVDPEKLPPEEPEAPVPEKPSSPLFGG